jgi:hypothetical protein
MTDKLSAESAVWLQSVKPNTFQSTLPTYQGELPMRVNREGVRNFLKNRGSLNIGDWAIEGSDMMTPRSQRTSRELFDGQRIPVKVVGVDAMNNHLRSVSSTPDLLHGNLQPPDPHHQMRVKPEGRASYVQDHDSRMKILMEHYGQFPLRSPTRPRTQGDVKHLTRIIRTMTKLERCYSR